VLVDVAHRCPGQPFVQIGQESQQQRAVAVERVVAEIASQIVPALATVERVVAVVAPDRIGAAVAVQYVGGAVTRDGVGKIVTGAVDRRRTNQSQIFDVGGRV
jgi:hypothetical protein